MTTANSQKSIGGVGGPRNQSSVTTPLFFGVCLLALAMPAAAQWRTGYFLQNESGSQTAATIPWSKYTHAVHSLLQPTYTDGTCGLATTEGPLQAADSEAFVNAAHAAGVKAIAGIGEDATHSAMATCTAPNHIAEFVEALRSFVAKSGYDGVDLDWQSGVIAPQYQDLVKRLRAAMPTATLSAAVGIAEKVLIAEVQYDLDQINIRANDSDLRDDSGQDQQTMDALSWSFMNAGTVASKLGLTVRFYGGTSKGCSTGSDPSSCAHDVVMAHAGPEQVQETAAVIKANKLGGIAAYDLSYDFIPTQEGDARYPLSSALYEARQ
jgi:hypothetical protein